MERYRVGIALLIVVVLGLIISGVGKIAATGIDLGETAIMAFDTVFLGFFVLLLVTMAVFEKDFSKDEQGQAEAEPDSSLY